MSWIKIRKSLPAIGMSLLLAGCAGTAPGAIQRGFPAASLDPTNRINCEETENPDRCARNRDLNAINPLADHGFHDAKIWEAREARRDSRRRDRDARNRGD